ncbi:MAG TPA: plasmid pRiA4b ORF-3 family protein [Candidatus Hydrogenedentes bacterium]|nr:plasmid pRiA4b ORF-3 family protein [Candidatus Hydrogenedentota bacterium]HOL77665.1 plasmid pRiA4b ORF-3 family protein [Candidatus Hydrogenedentota bacterium]HPO86705.1 plasmid pRiA4b ORF-3 family protein [Candidatus Hydrogenedentota bacterium]
MAGVRKSVKSGKAKTVPKQPKVQIYDIKVVLVGSDPPIWRRFQVRNDITLDVLHQTIQTVMGWQDCHIHEFQIDDAAYGPVDAGGLEDVKDERKVRLSKVVKEEGARFRYVYDFGDDWEHELVVERISEPSKAGRYPICLDGEGACPPEDCGGVWGYYDMLQTIEDPADPEYEDVLEWLGDAFDPESFDIRQVNASLKKLQ